MGLVAILACTCTLVACSDNTPSATTQTTTTVAPPGSTSTTSACSVSGVDTGSKTANGTGGRGLLTDVRTGRQPCADRIVFDFREGGRPSYTVEYQPGPFGLGESDQTVTIDGSAFLVVRFEPASGVDLNDPSVPRTYTGPESLHPTGLAHVREIRQIEDFEAVLIWVIGLDGTRPFSVGVLDGPPRVYVDVA
jgi:hypothetical protein